MENKKHALADWIPYKLIYKDDAAFFEWIYLGEKRFTEPFFDDTIAQCRSHTYNSSRYKVITTAANLLEWSCQIVTVPLSGLIFHVSRCGSTMISQLLAIPSSNIVISEAPVIDQILRHEQLDIRTKRNLIYAVLKYLGKKRFSEEQHLILKLDAWHLLDIQRIRLFFSDIPFVLLYRNPEAVLKSHMQLRGMHMVPDMFPLHILGLDDSTSTTLSLNQYGTIVLEKYFQAIIDFALVDKNTLLVDYQEGMGNIIISLNLFLAIPISEESYTEMTERLKTHSKYPNRAFTDDKEVILNICLTFVNSLYSQANLLSIQSEAKQKYV